MQLIPMPPKHQDYSGIDVAVEVGADRSDPEDYRSQGCVGKTVAPRRLSVTPRMIPKSPSSHATHYTRCHPRRQCPNPAATNEAPTHPFARQHICCVARNTHQNLTNLRAMRYRTPGTPRGRWHADPAQLFWFSTGQANSHQAPDNTYGVCCWTHS